MKSVFRGNDGRDGSTGDDRDGSSGGGDRGAYQLQYKFILYN